MCSQNCVREFERLWQNSFRALLFAASHAAVSSSGNHHSFASTHPLFASSLSPSFAVSNVPQVNYTSAFKRRRRRKRNKTRRLLESLQRNSFMGANEANVEMQMKSIVSVKETHQMAELNRERNDKLKNALKISPNFVEGTSLEALRKDKEANAANASQPKKYELLRDTPSPQPMAKTETEVKDKSKHKTESKKKDNKRHRSRRHSSDSRSDSDSELSDKEYRKKKSDSSKRKRNDSDKKSKSSKSRKSRRHSDSSSDSSSSSDSESSSSSSSDSSDTSSDSSTSSSQNSRNEYNVKHRHSSKVSSVPKIAHKTKSHSKCVSLSDNEYKEIIEDKIRNLRREARKESERQSPVKDVKVISNETNNRKPLSERKQKYIRSRSPSSSDASDDGYDSKRLKSSVHELDKNRKIEVKEVKEVPKSYSSIHYHKRRSESRDRSESPYDKTRDKRLSPSPRRSRSRTLSSRSRSRSRSYSKSSRDSYSSSSASQSGRSDSRSPSIPRRKGSPSFLDKRRITSARKRPIPYRRSSPTFSSCSSSSCSTYKSRSRSLSSSHSFISSTYNNNIR